MGLNKIINLGSHRTLVNLTLAIIAGAAALVLSLTVLANVGHARVAYTSSADGLTYTFEAEERVFGSGTPEPTNWESLVTEDIGDCKTDATLEAAKADPDAYQYEENPGNPSITYARTFTNADDGKKLCVYAVFDGNPTDNPDAGRSKNGVHINVGSATDNTNTAAGAGDGTTAISGAGPKEDLLLGSLFVIGVIASISCVKIFT